MFDRFSDGARRVVAAAGEEARRFGHPHIGTEHLVLGLLIEGESPAAQALEAAGATVAGARDKVTEAVGQNRSDDSGRELPLTPRAKRALERASRFSLQRRDPQVGTEHVLLGVLDVEGRAGQVLRGLGVDVVSLRDSVDLSAADGRSQVTAVEPAAPERSSSPRCQACGTPLVAGLAFRVVPAAGEAGEWRDFTVVYCSACGSAFGATPA
jgi:ATP-dependent Clp protease ATP-binding subunit ClpA